MGFGQKEISTFFMAGRQIFISRSPLILTFLLLVSRYASGQATKSNKRKRQFYSNAPLNKIGYTLLRGDLLGDMSLTVWVLLDHSS
jgi:hypothetical protein